MCVLCMRGRTYIHNTGRFNCTSVNPSRQHYKVRYLYLTPHDYAFAWRNTSILWGKARLPFLIIFGETIVPDLHHTFVWHLCMTCIVYFALSVCDLSLQEDMFNYSHSFLSLESNIVLWLAQLDDIRT
ncbi:hypothetical protein GOP47_0001245 [Adiantum capillus-veneris]|uniref:Uncharacterized protein n=1 Tax=Adiantum capillus-veneris TaxID=13818 RepID=A0A9D4ZT11_ADICA|nr:hypothetical protein GOP47_0001245 [Adiantum capillus-veneris]